MCECEAAFMVQDCRCMYARCVCWLGVRHSRSRSSPQTPACSTSWRTSLCHQGCGSGEDTPTRGIWRCSVAQPVAGPELESVFVDGL